MDSFEFRYTEKTIEQAIVQKLARVLSGIGAATILNESGFVQEQALIHRTLDELDEDIVFLCCGIAQGEITELHIRYLEAFFQEDFSDPADPVGSRVPRPMIPRKKIRAYIAQLEQNDLSPSRGIEVSKTLNQAYSGFIHGAHPQIMEMYGGYPPRFHVNGMLGTPRIDEYRRDLGNYIYRGMLNLILVAMVIGLDDMLPRLYEFRDRFEKETGIGGSNSNAV